MDMAVLIAGAVTCGSVIGQTIHVDAAAGHATNTIVPTQALGAGVDRVPYGASDKLLTEENLIPASRSIGHGASR